MMPWYRRQPALPSFTMLAASYSVMMKGPPDHDITKPAATGRRLGNSLASFFLFWSLINPPFEYYCVASEFCWILQYDWNERLLQD